MSANPRHIYATITENYSYDNNGNLLTRTVPTPADHTFTYNGVDKRTGYTSPLQKATTYTYNKSKQLTQIERPSGKTITNTYDKGRLVSTLPRSHSSPMGVHTEVRQTVTVKSIARWQRG
ncbi:hypothetical protein [Sulfurovum sp.]|uniref:hypothetical protein n=1 Tax=Sulfurovum sp. TaxID=1969726 RepID=UPI002A362E93|nr:hypothetical protein [Sulfurovum sp.]MDY0402588.1 hypothetical protein [Sulfurovum sp.]